MNENFRMATLQIARAILRSILGQTFGRLTEKEKDKDK